jgi:hypothetical protein
MKKLSPAPNVHKIKITDYINSNLNFKLKIRLFIFIYI